MFLFHAGKTTDTGTDNYTNAVRIFFCHIKSCHIKSFSRSCYCILRKYFHSSCSFIIQSFFYIKVFHFRCDLHFIIFGIKLCNLSDTYLFFFNSIPELVYCVSNRSHSTQSSNYYSSFHKFSFRLLWVELIPFDG